jgi:predicted metal-binding membrane protein
MLLLFTAGVMNLIWVATIAAFVLIEKLAPHGLWIARIGGVAMLGIAVWLAL